MSANLPSETSVIERARQAAMEPYSPCPASIEEWLEAIKLGADAAIRVLLEHLREEITPIWDGDEQVDDAVSGRHIRRLLA